MTRDEQRAETRRRILDSAATMFSEVGFHAASIEEITDRAGYSRGAFYSNFTSKEDLYLTLAESQFDQRMAELAGLFQRLEQDSTFDVFSAIEASGPVEGDRPRVVPDLKFPEFAFSAARNPEFRPRLATLHRRIRAAMAEMVTAQARQLGFKPTFPPETLASMEMALEVGLILQEMIDPGSVPEDFLIRFLEFVVRAMKELDGG